MFKEHFNKRLLILIILSLVYAVFSVYVYNVTKLTIHLGMIWNVFLAFLPWAFSVIIVIALDKKLKFIAILFGILWLLFFPNAPYIMTNFIHLSTIHFYTSGEFDIVSWLRLIQIGLGFLLGISFGMISLYNVHQSLLKVHSKRVVYSAFVIIALLSGYAIYIGRLLRYNSWDILKPVMLFNELISNINMFALLYSILFGFYILFTYVMFYFFIKKN